ncbi:MAG: hypothetical protein LBF97_07855 [Elusimicrobiota bacterium]|jgi:hypothetical protein|nr:hypothetical protein [Elusimicrobiota bacterium]
MELIKNLLLKFIGNFDLYPVISIILSALIFILVKKTKTKKDDDMLEKFILPCLEYANSVIPDSEKLNKDWLKITKNMLVKFIEQWTKQEKLLPNASQIDRFKVLAEDIAKQQANPIKK